MEHVQDFGELSTMSIAVFQKHLGYPVSPDEFFAPPTNPIIINLEANTSDDDSNDVDDENSIVSGISDLSNRFVEDFENVRIEDMETQESNDDEAYEDIQCGLFE